MRLLSFLNETNTHDVNDFTLTEMRLLELRNVLNADEITDWSKERSQMVATRITDDPNTQAAIFNWMAKSLRKYILTQSRGSVVGMFVGNKRYFTRNTSGNISDLPPWAQKVLLAGDELLYINPEASSSEMNITNEVNLVRDWLRYKLRTTPEQITPNRLSRISFENALKLSDDYHQELERKRPATEIEVRDWYLGANQGGLRGWNNMTPGERYKVYSEFTKRTGREVVGSKDTPEKHKLIKEYGDGNKWVGLTTQSCLDYEGNMMGHCVSDYTNDVDSGYVDIISLRDNKNEPHVTMEVINKNGTVSQIKGKGNKPPVTKYIPYVVDLLNMLHDQYGKITFSNDGEMDLSGMDMLYEKIAYNEYNSGIVKIISPPFKESDKFIVELTTGLDDDSAENTETMEGSLAEIIFNLENEYSTYINASDASYILDRIVTVGVWNMDMQGNEDFGLLIWYGGKDKDVRRTLKTVVPD